jgi:hypothetical protein
VSRHCSYHCGGCDQHFTSLKAFDAHRAGAYDKRRFCRPASNVRKLRALPGSCALTVAAGESLALVEVLVWEDGASVDKARGYFSRSPKSDSAPSTPTLRGLDG